MSDASYPPPFEPVNGEERLFVDTVVRKLNKDLYPDRFSREFTPDQVYASAQSFTKFPPRFLVSKSDQKQPYNTQLLGKTLANLGVNSEEIDRVHAYLEEKGYTPIIVEPLPSPTRRSARDDEPVPEPTRQNRISKTETQKALAAVAVVLVLILAVVLLARLYKSAKTWTWFRPGTKAPVTVQVPQESRPPVTVTVPQQKTPVTIAPQPQIVIRQPAGIPDKPSPEDVAGILRRHDAAISRNSADIRALQQNGNALGNRIEGLKHELIYPTQQRVDALELNERAAAVRVNRLERRVRKLSSTRSAANTLQERRTRIYLSESQRRLLQ